jgi:signal transduction histidine kinase
LGLAIVKKIVEEHGGAISINSESGRGTKAIVMITGSNQIGD